MDPPTLPPSSPSTPETTFKGLGCCKEEKVQNSCRGGLFQHIPPPPPLKYALLPEQEESQSFPGMLYTPYEFWSQVGANQRQTCTRNHSFSSPSLQSSQQWTVTLHVHKLHLLHWGSRAHPPLSLSVLSCESFKEPTQKKQLKNKWCSLAVPKICASLLANLCCWTSLWATCQHPFKGSAYIRVDLRIANKHPQEVLKKYCSAGNAGRNSCAYPKDRNRKTNNLPRLGILLNAAPVCIFSDIDSPRMLLCICPSLCQCNHCF